MPERRDRAAALAFAGLSALLLSGAGHSLAPWEAEGPAPTARLFAPGVISTGDDDAHVTFSADRRHVYFLKSWPDQVNSAAWDSGPRPSPDGRFLFFTSNRVAGERAPGRASPACDP